MFGTPHHFDLTVSDIEAAVAFYDKVLPALGYQRTDQYAGGAPCWLYSSDRKLVFGIALHEARNQAAHDRYTPGMHHLAFRAGSRDEVNNFFDFLIENGIEILDPPAEYDYTPGYYAVFFADPDEIKLEVVYEPSPGTGAD